MWHDFELLNSIVNKAFIDFRKQFASFEEEKPSLFRKFSRCWLRVWSDLQRPNPLAVLQSRFTYLFLLRLSNISYRKISFSSYSVWEEAAC